MTVEPNQHIHIQTIAKGTLFKTKLMGRVSCKQKSMPSKNVNTRNQTNNFNMIRNNVQVDLCSSRSNISNCSA